MNYGFRCPCCHKVAEEFFPRFFTVPKALDLIVFSCSSCRLIYIDKTTIRTLVSEWRKGSATTRRMPFKKLFEGFWERLEKMVNDNYIVEAGYKPARFIKYCVLPKP